MFNLNQPPRECLIQRANDGVLFEELYHVAHVADAKEIIRSSRVMQAPVGNGVLEDSGIKVAWMSPNDWRTSIYGQVRFVMQVRVFLEKTWRYYWVEDIKHSRQHALRILISRQDHGKTLAEFDPRSLGSPIFIDQSDRFHTLPRNRSPQKLNYEFMIDGTIPMTRITRMDFVRHNRSICKAYGTGCSAIVNEESAGWESPAYRLFFFCIAAQKTDILSLSDTSYWGHAVARFRRAMRSAHLRRRSRGAPAASALAMAISRIAEENEYDGPFSGRERSSGDEAARRAIAEVVSEAAFERALRAELEKADARWEKILASASECDAWWPR